MVSGIQPKAIAALMVGKARRAETGADSSPEDPLAPHDGEDADGHLHGEKVAAHGLMEALEKKDAKGALVALKVLFHMLDDDGEDSEEPEEPEEGEPESEE